MNIFIIEDEPLYSEQLEAIVEDMGHTVCGIADNAQDALRKFEQSNPHIALVDINLNGEMDGLELGKWLKRFKNIIIIYITSYTEQEYFETAKELSAFAFLQKPIHKVSLERTIALAANFSATHNDEANSPNDFLILKQKAKYIKISQQQIAYIEADDKYCSVVMDDGTVYTDRCTLKSISLKLNPYLFAQSHRSFLVNLDKINEINVQDYMLSINSKQVPLGATYKDYFLKKFLQE